MRQSTNTDKNSKCILIVCGAGVGTSLLIKQQLQNILGPNYNYEIKDVREVDPEQFSKFDMVVTTTSLPETSKCVIKVNPIITEEQVKKLLRSSISTNLRKTNRALEMLHIVEKHATINDEKSLLSAMRVFFGETSKELMDLHLIDILSRDRIQYIDQVCTADEAIHISCFPLEQAGLITLDYADEILALIKEFGCYSEFREGILLAHAQPGKSTHGTGMALTIFKHAVVFEEWEKEYKAIFTLCAIDHESHFPAIKDLLWMLSSKDTCQTLITWPGESIGDLYTFIVEDLSKRKE